MPVISYDHEMDGEEDEEEHLEERKNEGSVVAGELSASAQGKKKKDVGRKSGASQSANQKEDSNMAGDSDSGGIQSEEEDDGLTPEERLK